MSLKSEAFRAKSAAFRERAKQASDASAKAIEFLLAECYAGLARHAEWLATYRNERERARNGLPAESLQPKSRVVRPRRIVSR